ncbi:hypothetical protein KIN20_025071 [Parelaphostrongylus tenuis]|nr:hypothetical protein KIN20_023196 [Parelaphostrongylus tenuis]KAJ1364882.1 hypothetical protein KIN20_025071 [Parelaphostrongylus tenuis]
MNTPFALFIFIAVMQAGSEHYRYKEVAIPESCDNITQMTSTLRRQSLWLHNTMRWAFQNGWYEGEGFPNSSNMSLLNYDCELEKAAYNIAVLCPNNTDPSFNYTGSNNFTGFVEAYANTDLLVHFFQKAYWFWHSTRNTTLVGLTPSESNKAMIPFLQTMVGSMTKLGCAFYPYCNSSDTSLVNTSLLVSYVCQYGEP